LKEQALAAAGQAQDTANAAGAAVSDKGIRSIYSLQIVLFEIFS